MVEGTSFMGLGGPNLVKGATGQEVDGEELGGAKTHTTKSAVAHYRAPNDLACTRMIREYVERLPAPLIADPKDYDPPTKTADDIYDLFPDDHRMAYEMRDVLSSILDGGVLEEFQPDLAQEMICGHGRIEGYDVAVIANHRGLVKRGPGERPHMGGIVYTESAEKVAYFIETANRQGIPLLFVQDVSGFMVGPEAEHSGIIRAGALFVEAMATATVPKIVLTINHASGAGYYAMSGQGFDPDFIFSWPTGRMGVMEGEAAARAVYGSKMDDPELAGEIEKLKNDYDRQLDAKHAAAAGQVDAIITPEDTRDILAMALRTTRNYRGPHLGAFVLPPMENFIS